VHLVAGGLPDRLSLLRDRQVSLWPKPEGSRDRRTGDRCGEALASEGRRLSHVVFMGMGEPMANYQSVVESVRRIADPELLGISPRRIVVSTSGLIPRIEQLGAEKLPVTLAISLHAARNELRDVLVPINRKYPLDLLVKAAQGYADTTGRRVSYEWVLLAGVNDTERDAKELGGCCGAGSRT